MGALKTAKYDLKWNDPVNPQCGQRLFVEWGSHEPGDGSRQEILIAETDVARHGRVSLPEDLRHALELRAHLDEAVQMDTGSSTSYGEAPHQRLGKLGTQVVAHLSEG